MGIADDMQHRGSLRAGNKSAVFDQRPSNALTPQLRLYEQTVQFHLSIRPRQKRRESGNRTIHFRNKHSTSCNLLSR